MQRLFFDVALQLNSHDNIAIAKHDLDAGIILAMPAGAVISLRKSIPAGHKFALQAIACDEPVLWLPGRLSCHLKDSPTH